MSLALLNNDVFVAMVLQSIVLAMPFFVGKECLAEGFANHATGNSSMETFFTETGSIITTITVSVYKTATSSSFTAVKTCNAKSAFIAASRDPFNKKSAFIAGSQDSIDTIADFAYDSWGHHLFHNILVHILFGLLIMVMAIGLAFVFRPRIVRHAIIPSKQDLDQLGQALKGAIGTLQSLTTRFEAMRTVTTSKTAELVANLNDKTLKLANVTLELVYVTKKFDDTTLQLNETRSQLNDTTSLLYDASSRLDKVTKQMVELRALNAQADVADVLDLQKDLESTKATNSRLFRVIRSKNEFIAKLEKSLSSKDIQEDEDYHKLLSEYKELDVKYKGSVKQHDDLQAAYDELRSKHEGLENKMQSLRSRLEEKIIRYAESQLKRKEDKQAMKSEQAAVANT